MKLSELLQGLECEIVQKGFECEITSLTSDSRKVTENGVFICITGAVSDGHKYIPQVIQKKAGVIVIQDSALGNDETASLIKEIPSDITIVKAQNTRLALAVMSANYFGNPAKKLFTIGITGTKGKTTTTYMVKNVLDACGIKTGLIGTIETIIGDEHTPACNTTPESYDIHKSFAKMAEQGCKAVVMEVSSQGLKLDRTAGIMFDIGVFTNLEPDHIGEHEHKDFADYMHCKSLLFRQCRLGIFNGDDEHLEGLMKGHTCQVETYGYKSTNNLVAENVELKKEHGAL
ncbi:MAG: UDP-N-acetylmuramoyl-L-alanyl-D-glutamate--2,6-diaminopimelate ligase, partial [Lachnospira sp.]|nr:UDP-N-acetylmuramoyl-L-alanyl-D-glutamate--2,6-diaminopimelate ligase [Lachnospira sp.]